MCSTITVARHHVNTVQEKVYPIESKEEGIARFVNPEVAKAKDKLHLWLRQGLTGSGCSSWYMEQPGDTL